MKTFEVNNVTYTAREIDFNFLCDLEDEGISLADVDKKPMSAIRAYFTMCHGGSKEVAGKEIESHLIGGGNLEELMEAFADAIQKSDFFQAISKSQEKATTKRKKTPAAEK